MICNGKVKIVSYGGNRRAFTLVEMLLVLAIIGIITAITIPRLGGVIKGSRLKSASRTVIRLGRYARSMAVLHQRPAVIVFDIDGGEIAVNIDNSRMSHQQQSSGNDQQPSEDEESETEKEATDKEREWGMKVKLDKVRIASVIYGDNGKNFETGKCSIVYETNGRCTPYSVKLQGDDGRCVVVDFDFISTAKIKTDKDT